MSRERFSINPLLVVTIFFFKSLGCLTEQQMDRTGGATGPAATVCWHTLGCAGGAEVAERSETI
jgi:hypothetical protein